MNLYNLFIKSAIVVISAFTLCSCDSRKVEPDGKVSPSEIRLDQDQIQLQIDNSVSLTYTTLPTQVQLTNLIWTSSNQNVATVSQSGLVTAVAVGEAQIKVQSGQLQDIAHIRVVPGPLKSISFEGDVIPAYINESKSLTLTFDPQDAIDKTVVWSTPYGGIIGLDQTGTITPKALGYAYVLADHYDKVYKSAVIVPAYKGQVVAASQVNSVTHDNKYFINVYIGALDKGVIVKDVKLFVGGDSNNPDAVLLKTVTSTLSIPAGKGQEILIEVSPQQGDLLSYGRHVKIGLSVGGDSYTVTLGWQNQFQAVKNE